MKEYIDVLKKWKDFDGRARRREYWMFVLFMAIFAIVAGIIDAILGTICVFVGIYYLAMLLPMIAVSIVVCTISAKADGGYLSLSYR